MSRAEPVLAIVDYGMGNLFSVLHAFAAVGQQAVITDSPAVVEAADAVVIPGVGAFGVAMDVLSRTGLADAIRARADRGAPIIGVCLGLQLLMSASTEFGAHDGLAIVPGDTIALTALPGIDASARIPHVGWSAVVPTRPDGWAGTPLGGLAPGSDLYFVHSYCVEPADPGVTLSSSTYRGATFCSSVAVGNVFGCQFHPERSAVDGLDIYRRLVAAIRAGQPFGEMT
jgi:glutamine amidotransferase